MLSEFFKEKCSRYVWHIWKLTLSQPYIFLRKTAHSLMRFSLRINGVQRILSCKDLSFPFLQFELDFSNSQLGHSHKEICGIYDFKGLVLHTTTGTLIKRPVNELRPTIIDESNLEDFHARITSSSVYSKICSYEPSEVPVVFFKCPVFIFEIFKRKSNYYHFTADNVMRLVTFLENIREKCVVLHSPGCPKYALELFQILEKLYEVTFEPYPAEPYVKIMSSVYVMDHISKPNFHDFEISVSSNLERLKAENYEEYEAKNFSPSYRISPLPYHWISSSKTSFQKKFRSDDIQNFPSRTSGLAVRAFTKKFIDYFDIESVSTKIIFIDREGDTSRGRHIKNIREIQENFTDIEFVKFGNMSIKDQIINSIQARVMIGIHGAGLANSIYCQKGASLLNLMPENFYAPRSNLMKSFCGSFDINYEEIDVQSLDDDSYYFYLDPDELSAALSILKKH